MKREEWIVLIYDAMYRMGFKANSTGFFYLSYSVYLCICEARSCMVTMDWLCARVAEHYHAEVQDIRHDMYTAVTGARKRRAWHMENAEGKTPKSRPSEIEVIRYLYRSLTSQYLRD